MGMCPTISNFGDRKALYIAHKIGRTFCLDPLTGANIWVTVTAPGGVRGSHKWGVSVDDTRVYVGVVNGNFRNWSLTNGSFSTGGGWMALDKVTGAIQWTTANPAAYDPSGGPEDPLANGRSSLAWGMGPPAVVGDIVLVGSTDVVTKDGDGVYGSGGYVYALRKTDGRILSSFETRGTVYGGFAADSRCAFVGSGYKKGPLGSVGIGVYGWCI
jgi:polyvinyl alcohol dehydrogenase (cytochrome)